MKILVTGSTGFVGRHLVPLLIEEGHQILEITRNIKLSEELYNKKSQKFHLTNGNQKRFSQAVQKFNPEIVIHLAAYSTASDDYKSLELLLNSNISFTCRLLDTLKDTTIKFFINTGTFAEYFRGDGNFDPAYLYSATKSASRSLIKYYSNTYNFKYFTICPYTIYGGLDTRKKIIDILYDSLDSDAATDITAGDQILDFIHVNDVVSLYTKIIENIETIPNEANFHCGTGMGYTLKELVSFMEKSTGKTANIHWGAKEYRKRDIMRSIADISLQLKLLEWQPKITLEEGIKIYLQAKSKKTNI